MTQLQRRLVTTLLPVPIPDGVEVLYPEQIILTFSNNQTLDIGALCYLRRQRPIYLKGQRRKRDVKDMLVDLSSLDHTRSNLIKRIIAYISADVANGRRDFINYWIRIIYFFNWLDDNNLSGAFDSDSGIRLAFSTYNKYIKERFEQSAVSRRHAAGTIRMTKQFLNGFLGTDDIDRGVALLSEKRDGSSATAPISEADRKKILALCDAFFKNVTIFVLKNEPYPYRIHLPLYLGWDRNEMWIFPNAKWCMTPEDIAKRDTLNRQYWAYNYVEGRVSTLQELIDINAFPTRSDYRQGAIRAAENNLKQSNADSRHLQRMKMVSRAQHAFVVLFMLYTAMNFEQVRQLKWDKNSTLKTEVGRQGFRVVKWRAGGKEQNFEIQSKFYPDFLRFLELRQFALGGYDFEYLFFSLFWYKDSVMTPMPMSTGSEIRYFYRETLQHIDPSLPRVVLQQFRASKSDWMLRNNVSPSTAATILQNSEETINRSYAAGSPIVHQEEMTSFFDCLTSKIFPIVVCDAESPEDTMAGPAGSCAVYCQPLASNTNAPWKPDCRDPEGCFWCANYRVHADETDVRKLYSCRFCIQCLSVMTESTEEFEQRFWPVVDRIDEILDEVRPHLVDHGLLERVKYQVEEEGELSDYWAAKFSMLINLGFVTS